MSAFTIYSVADDVSFLSSVLNAVAMITGEDSYTKALSVAALAGVLIVLVQGLLKDGSFPRWQSVLVGWAVVIGLIVPKETVNIQSIKSLNVQVVDNVPYIVGLAGNLTSTIGMSITELFEQGFKVPTDTEKLTKSGFIDPLKSLMSIRRLALTGDGALYQALNAGSGDYLVRENLINYMYNCTLPSVSLGHKSKDTLWNTNASSVSSDAIKDFKTGGYTDIRKTDGTVEYKNCQDAATTLDTMLSNAVTSDNPKGAMQARFGSSADPTDKRNPWAAAVDATTLLGGTSNTGYEFLKATIIKGAYEQAERGHAASMLDTAAAIARSEAIQKRNFQWATEGSEFVKQMDTYATFAEALVYAATPMAGLMIASGLMFSIVARYLQFLLWIALWIPTLAIVNLFTWQVVQTKLAGMSSSFSFATIEASGQMLESAIATAGYMASLTPIFAMFLAFASGQVLNTLASKFSGGGLEGKLNTSAVSPDAIGNSPYLQSSAMVNDQTSGIRAVGADGAAATISSSEILSNMKTSAENKMRSASESFNNTFDAAFGTEQSKSRAYDKIGSFAKDSLGSAGQSYSAAMSTIDKLAKNGTITTSEADQIKKSLTGTISGGGTVGAGAEAGIKSAVGNDKSKTDAVQTALAQTSGYDKSASFNKAQQSAFLESVKGAITESAGTKLSAGEKASLGEKLSKSVQDIATSSEEFRMADSLQRSSELKQSLSTITLGHQLAGNGEFREMVRMAESNPEYNRAYNRAYQNGAGTKGNQNASQVQALYDTNSAGLGSLLARSGIMIQGVSQLGSTDYTSNGTIKTPGFGKAETAVKPMIPSMEKAGNDGRTALNVNPSGNAVGMYEKGVTEAVNLSNKEAIKVLSSANENTEEVKKDQAPVDKKVADGAGKIDATNLQREVTENTDTFLQMGADLAATPTGSNILVGAGAATGVAQLALMATPAGRLIIATDKALETLEKQGMGDTEAATILRNKKAEYEQREQQSPQVLRKTQAEKDAEDQEKKKQDYINKVKKQGIPGDRPGSDGTGWDAKTPTQSMKLKVGMNGGRPGKR